MFQRPQLWGLWFKIHLSQEGTNPVPTIPSTKLFDLKKHETTILYEIKILFTIKEKFLFPALNKRPDQ